VVRISAQAIAPEIFPVREIIMDFHPDMIGCSIGIKILFDFATTMNMVVDHFGCTEYAIWHHITTTIQLFNTPF
jgi:hypothetical protein